MPEVGKAGDRMLIDKGSTNADSEDLRPTLSDSLLRLVNSMGDTGGRLESLLSMDILGGGVDARRISLAVVDWLRPLLGGGA